jgi:Leucine-rich repeat (LRR) protein
MIPAAGVGAIDATTLQRTITIPAGETLNLVSTVTPSDAGGNATIAVLPGGAIRVNAGARIQGAGGGNRWQISGTLELVDDGAVISSGMFFAPGATLRYTGTVPATTGFEWIEGLTNVRYATGFPGNVIISNTGGVSMPAATSVALGSGTQLTLSPGGIFAFSAGTTLNMLNGAGYCGGGGTFRGNATATFIKGNGPGACGCIGFSAPQMLQNYISTGGFALSGNLTITGALNLNTGAVFGVGSCTVGRLTLQGTNVVAAGSTLEISGSGILEIDGNAPISGGGAVKYSSVANILSYIGAANMVAGIEWPATMAGQVAVNKGGANVVQLNAAPARTQNGALTVQSGYLDVLSGGTLALGGASSVAAWMRVLGTGVVSGGNNLTILASGNLNLDGTAWSWTGTPTYNANSYLRYTGAGTRTSGAELPAVMNGNFGIEQLALTLGGNTQFNGSMVLTNFIPGATLNTGAYSATITSFAYTNPTTTINVSAGGTLALNNTTLGNDGAVNVAATGVVNCINASAVGNNDVGYAAGGTLIYSGAGGAAATNGEFPFPMAGNVIINKPGSGYGLTGSRSVNGSFTLQAGQIDLGGNDLTLNGPVNFSGGQVVGNLGSNLTIGAVPGGAVTGPLTFATTFTLNNFTYNRPTGLTLGSALTVNGSFVLTNASGSFSTGANTLRLSGTPNTTIGGSTLTVASTGRLRIDNARTLTNAGTLQVGAAGTLELNGTAQITTAPTYLGATSVLEYTGPTARPTCGPEIPSSFGGSIRMNNADGVTAPNFTVNMTGGGAASLTLAQGNWILSAPAALLHLWLTPITGGSATSYVQTAGENNVLTRTTATSVPIDFPVGTAAGYRPVRLTNPSAAANASISVVAGAPPGGTNGTGILGIPAANEYWALYAASALNSPVQFTKAGAITASTLIGQNGSGMSSGPYNSVTATNAVPNSLTTTPAINLNAGPNYQRFALGAIGPPTQQATSFSATGITSTGFMGSFGAANAPTPARYLVVMRPLAAAPTSPVNGTGYTVGTALGGGTVIADLAHAAGIINIPTLYTTGLTPGGQYAVDIFSYNGSGAGSVYLASPTTGVVYLSSAVSCASIPTTVNADFSGFEREIQFTGVSLTGAGVISGSGTNTAFVSPGGTVTVSFNYAGIGAPPTYCPGCITQLYVGMDNAGTTVFQDCFSGNPHNASGSGSPSFTAPATPGVYYINSNVTWQYSCIPVNFAPGYVAGNTIAKIIVGAPPCVSSGDILTPETVPPVAFTYNTTIPYIFHLGGTVPATAPNVFAFRLRDGGPSAVLDGLPTTLTAISIQLNDPNGVVQTVRLYNGATPISGNVPATPTLNFTGLSVIAADGALSPVITVKATYRTTPTTPPMDGATFNFTINGATVAAGGSGLFNPAAVIGPSGNSGVDVTATALQFVQQPTNTPVGVAMTPPVRVAAVDANGNTDLTYPPTISVAHPNLVGSPVAVAPVGGTASFAGLVFNSAPLTGITLTAAGGTIAAANSAAFNITPQTFYLQPPLDASFLLNWNTLPGGGGSTPAAFTYPGSTFQTQAGQTGVVPAPWAIAAGVTVAVVPNSTLQIQSGQTFTKNGTLTIAGAGTLELQGSAAIVAGAAVQYQALNSVLIFTGTAALSVGNVSLPNVMNGSVFINRTGGLLEMTGPINVAGNFTMNAGNAVINGGTNLTVAGTTSIAGGIFGLNANATMNANGPYSQTGGAFNQNNGNVIMGNTFTLSGGNYNGNGTGNLTLNGASTLNGGFMGFFASGNLFVNDIINISTGQLSMNGTGALNVAAGGALNLSGTGQVFLGATAAPANILGAFSLAGTSQFDVNVGTVNFNGAMNLGMGTLNSASGSGTVNIGGTGAITGALRSTSLGYASFTMNRAGASLALGSTLGTNLLNLTNGYIVSSTTNPLIVITPAPAGITGGSMNSFVAGELQQPLPAGLNGALGNGPFVFPVGKYSAGGVATYIPITLLNVTTGTAPVIAAEAYVGASGGSLGVGITALSSTEYWRMQLVSGVYTSGNVRLNSLGALIPQSVVAYSTTPNGVYTGAGAITVSGNVVTSKEIAGLPGYFSAAGPPAQYFYYKPGNDPRLASSWNSEIDSSGAPAGDFTTIGNFFVVPAGRTAALTSGNMTFGLGTILQTNTGGVFSIGAGRTVVQNGTQMAGRLRLEGNATISGPSVFYQAGSELEYAPSASRTSTDIEFPDPLTARLIVNSGANNTLTLNANKVLNAGLSLLSGTLAFTNRNLSIFGAIQFNGGLVAANASSNLSVGGGTAIITGALSAAAPLTLGSLSMSRTGRTLALAVPVNVQNTLNLIDGVIATSPTSPLTVLNTDSLSVTAQGGYVDGPLRRMIPPMVGGIGTYIFPLGNRGLYLPAALDKPVTGLLPQMLEAQAYADSVGVPGTGLLTISRTDYLRMMNLTGGGVLSGSVQFRRTVGFNPTNLVGTTLASMSIGAFNAIPSTSSSLILSGGPVALDSAVGRLFIIGSVGQPPSIGLISPSATATGATVTVEGANFFGVTQVFIAGVAVPTFTVDSAKTIRFALPPGVTSGTVTVVALAGTAVSSQTFRTVPAPAITSISPLLGPSGTAVTILGRYFSNTTSVRFASTPALTYSVVNDTLAYAVIGAGATGNIRLTTPSGTGVSQQVFTLVQPPIVTEIQPTSATVGDIITIIGRGFSGTTSVDFPPVTGATFTVISDTEIRVTVPDGVSGAIMPTVSNPAGSTTSTVLVNIVEGESTSGTVGVRPVINTFNVEVQTIRTTNPDGSITLTTIATVTVTGANLTTVSSVSVGGTPALNFTAATNGTRVVFQVVTSATGTIAITTPLGTATSSGVFNLTNGSIGFVNAPALRGFEPRSGQRGTSMVITGERLLSVRAVFIGGVAVESFRIVNSTTITAVVGTGATGFIAVVSTNGTARTLERFIFLSDTLKPDILTFTPTTGATGATVTITGVHFSAEKIRALHIGGTPAESFMVNSTTEIVAVVGSGTSGFISLTLRDSSEVFSDSLFVFEGSKFTAFDSDSLALVRFYRTTGGTSWVRASSTWLTTQPLSQWDGVTVEEVGGVRRVTKLELSNNGIANLVSTALGDLNALRVLNLSGNPLGGAFPTWISRLQSLQELRLARAGFTGALPDELFDILGLRALDVSGNNLTGRFPAFFCGLGALSEISMQGNNFTGELPDCLWQLANMESLDISGNRFEGALPQAVAQIFPLKTFRAAGNNFTGTLPPFGITAGLAQKAIKASAAAKAGTLAASASPLAVLDVSNNRITGTIPPSFGNLANLSSLILNDNQLTGQIPSNIWNSTALTEVRLNNNQLTGEVPPSIGQARALRVLTLDNNRLTGALPDSVTKLLSLRVLSLAVNRITFVPNLAPLSNLDTLRVENNALTFESLEPNRNVPVFVYRRQDSVGAGGVVVGLLGKRFTLDGTVGGLQNQYRWFKRSWVQAGGANGAWQQQTTELTGQTAGLLVIPSFQATDTASAYYCTITNPMTPDLTLVLRPFTVLSAVPAKPMQSPTLVYPVRSARNIPPFSEFVWQPVFDENQYVLELSTDSTFASVTQRVTVAATTASVTGMRRATRYWWRVAAVNQGGMGPWSETVTSATAQGGVRTTANHRAFQTIEPGIDLALPTVDFGRVTVGEQATVNGVRVVNVSDTPVQLSSITLADGNTFTLSGSTSGASLTIPAQGTATLPQNFTFKPSSTGHKQTDVTLAYRVQSAGGIPSQPQQLVVRSGLVGRAGALWVDTVRFGTVLSGRSSIATARIVNRDTEPVRLRRATIVPYEKPTSIFTPEILEQGGIVLGAGDTTAITIRARASVAGFVLDNLVVAADEDTASTVVRATARRELPTDVIIEVGVRAVDSLNVAPGQPVNLEFVLLTNNRERLFSAQATQPIFTAVVSFDKNILALDEQRSSAFRSALKSAATRDIRVTLANERWSGQQLVLGRIPCLAVQGDTDKTRIVIEQFTWGGAGTAIEDVLAQQVFLTDLRAGTFESVLCKAGGKRLVRPATATSLVAARPNPASDQATVTYSLREDGMTTLQVFDAKGALITTVVNRMQSAGKYDAQVDVSKLPSGAYVLVLTTPTARLTERLDVVK